MLRSMPFAVSLCAFLLATLGSAQELTESEIDFENEKWKLESYGSGEARSHMGREAIFLERAQITLVGREFSEGVIEFDLAAEQASGFVGVNFRADDEGNSEQFYVRFHQSGRPDASQYLARLNGLASWQLHAGPNDAAAVVLGVNQWIPVRIMVAGDQADIFVRDMETPLLHVPRLRSDNDSGSLTFYAFDRPEMITGAYFSKLKVRPLNGKDEIVGKPREEPQVADTVIRTWQISSPLSEADLAGSFDLESVKTADLTWRPADVERNGILNIARYEKKAKEADTVLVRLGIRSENDTTRLLRFGYSDRVRIYVNGRQQFFGNAQWRSRDYRFLGTVGLHDAVPLHLETGDNVVIAAVSESFGGWGFVGQIESRDGLTLH